MSFVITSTSEVFKAPTTVAAPPANTNPAAVNSTAAPVQLGGGTVSTGNAAVVGGTTASNTVSYTTQAAAAGQTQQVVVSGAGTRLNLNTGAAQVQAIGGGTIVETTQSQTDATTKTISLGDPTAPYNGVAVDTAATVKTVVIDPKTGAASVKDVSVATAAGNQGGPFAYYAHGGFGNDQMVGSNFADFIRGGAGNDTINGNGGNDLIRGGTGSDSVFGGTGADTLYYTADQFTPGGTDTDTFADFTSGTDKISINTAEISRASVTGIGTNTLTIAGPNGSTIRVVSGGTAIQNSDINFI